MKVIERPIYKCEGVEIDASRGCLQRNGHEEYLRQQTFQVLLYLLDHRQRVVSKQELIESIWRETAVTDNAIVQCIADLRKALADDPHNPRFIRTVPKVGYRFIGAVEEHPGEQSPSEGSETASSGEKSNGSSRLAPMTATIQASILSRRFGWKLGFALIAAVLVVTALSLVGTRTIRGLSGRQRDITLPQVPGKKPLAVMYFDNQSGNAGLDWLREGLADMLITDLARSDRVTVLSRQQLHLLLERTERRAGDRIRLDEALDIARRSHAEVVLLGSFATVGDEVRIDAQLYDSGNGQLIGAERLVVDAPGQILTHIDLLSLKLLTHLGVTAAELGQKESLAEVMTDNLEAYRYYSLGLEKVQAFENAEAIRLFAKAVELDPRFGMAYARIGYAYAVTDFLPEKGMPYLQKAFQLSDRLTDKDRLYITGWYAIAREDYPGAVRTFRQIVRQYPLEVEAYWRLGRLLHGEEQCEEDIQILKQGLAIDPEAKDLYNGLGVVLMGLGKYDEAIAAERRYVALAPDEPNAHDSLGMAFQQSGRCEEALAEYKRALALNPEFEPAIIHLGDVSFQQGLYRDAVKQYLRYIDVSRSDLARALGHGDIAYVCWRKGDARRAEQAAGQEMRYEKGAVWNSLVIALHRGNVARIEKLKDTLLKGLPNPERGARRDLRSYHYFLGYLNLRQHSTDEAIGHFREALRHLPPTSGPDTFEDCLANAYLELGQLDDAIEEYQRILNLNPNYPLTRYRLGKAFDLKGEHERARIEYQRFLEVWKKADPDIPEVLDARARLSQYPV